MTSRIAFVRISFDWSNTSHPADELAGLRQFLERLESGHMTLRLRHNHTIDVHHRAGLKFSSPSKREIAYLEQILAHTHTHTKPVAHGLYRERNGWGNQHSAHVKYDEGQRTRRARGSLPGKRLSAAIR